MMLCVEREWSGRSWNGLVCCCLSCSSSVAGISPKVVVNFVPQPKYEVERGDSVRMKEEEALG